MSILIPCQLNLDISDSAIWVKQHLHIEHITWHKHLKPTCPSCELEAVGKWKIQVYFYCIISYSLYLLILHIILSFFYSELRFLNGHNANIYIYTYICTTIMFFGIPEQYHTHFTYPSCLAIASSLSCIAARDVTLIFCWRVSRQEPRAARSPGSSKWCLFWGGKQKVNLPFPQYRPTFAVPVTTTAKCKLIGISLNQDIFFIQLSAS